MRRERLTGIRMLTQLADIVTCVLFDLFCLPFCSVHYLVSKGADPDLPTGSSLSTSVGSSIGGVCARSIPLSLLAHNRFGSAVVQPQILSAIEAGLADRDKQRKNVKRNAVERSVMRFKRAERYMIDADRARAAGQFESAALLCCYALSETRSARLVKEEVDLRALSQKLSVALQREHSGLVSFRQKSVRETLRAEAQRNFFLAERYVVDKSVRQNTNTQNTHTHTYTDRNSKQAKQAERQQHNTYWRCNGKGDNNAHKEP